MDSASTLLTTTRRRTRKQLYRIIQVSIVVALLIAYVPIGFLASHQAAGRRTTTTPTTTNPGLRSHKEQFSLEKAINFISNTDNIKAAAANNVHGATPMIRKFRDSKRKFQTPKTKPPRPVETNHHCDKWIVIAPISTSSTSSSSTASSGTRPSVAIKRAQNAPGWCTVIVSSDRKTSKKYMRLNGPLNGNQKETVHYVSMEEEGQELFLNNKYLCTKFGLPEL